MQLHEISELCLADYWPTNMDESMSSTASIPGSGQRDKTKLNSCTLCQQRKVKCDKRQPACSNCVKHRAICIYVAPSKSQRRKRKTLEEELMDRLKRYESLVQAHGISLDDRDLTSPAIQNDSGLEPSKTLSHKEPASSPEKENGNCHRSIKSSGKFIIDGGKQSFVESPLWNSLSEELQGPVDMSRLYQTSGKDLPVGASSEAFLNAGDLVLNSTATHSAVDLMALHPNSLIIFRLWQLFLDNVNPLIKLLHAPTTQRRLLDTISHLEHMSKEWEALMFAIYLLAIQSISANECQLTMGESKSTLVRRYHSAVRSALLRANFTSSKDILLVQAFTLYLLAVRQYHEPNAFWILTGTAVRLGQRMGLHRDGTLIGLSPFETEIRRRVWWRLMALDGQTAELCGAGVSVTSSQYDSKMPLNVNDSDLSSDMSALPPEHEGATEMIFCGSRNEIGLFLKNTKANGEWMEAGINEFSFGENDSHLDELEALIKHKYLEVCDPSIPLHLFTRITGEASIMALRLMTRHPRKYSQGEIEMSLKERDKVFWLCMHVLDYYNLTMRTESIQRFLWNVNVQFQWHAFIILANELQLRSEDDHTRDAWSKIEELFEYNQDVIVNINTPLHNAVSRLILKAWSKRQNCLRRKNIQLTAPVFIATLQDQVAKQDAASHSTTSCVPSEQTATEFSPASQLSTEPTFDTNGFLETLMPNMVADGIAIDWSDWDNMLQDFEFPNASFAQT